MTSAFAQPLTCYPIRRGDTTAGLAQRFTGRADNQYQPWFQIANTTARFIPKSRYEIIQPGWRVCVDLVMVRHEVMRSSAVALAPPLVSRTRTLEPTLFDVSALWWAAPLLVMVWGLGLASAANYVVRRRVMLDRMRHFGERFVAEFERPLFRRTTASPIKARLRFAPVRRRLEIRLRPADGRTYPNLFDHRKNVEYDVERVERLLHSDAFVSGSLHAEGRWVVIPFRMQP